ncbi:MAG: ABC transporter ATP-binding protein, partial [Pseudomonadota bacterium]
LMIKFDSKQIIIKLSEPLKELPSELLSDSMSINTEGNLVYRYHPSEANIHEILTKISYSGLVMRDLVTKEADLEDVFRYLTSQAA